jgi:hypothetical protein
MFRTAASRNRELLLCRLGEIPADSASHPRIANSFILLCLLKDMTFFSMEQRLSKSVHHLTASDNVYFATRMDEITKYACIAYGFVRDVS